VITTKSSEGKRGTRCGPWLVLAVLGASACTGTSTVAPNTSAAAIDASHEFQRGYDQQLRDDPVSVLTTIAAHYLAPGNAISVAVGATNVTLEATAEALLVSHDTVRHRFQDSATLALDDRHTLSISRQEQDFRVLVHDREAPLRTSFPGVTWFPVDARFIVEAHYTASSPREPMLLQTSRGLSKTLYVAGEATFELDGETATLLVFAYAPEPQPAEPLLIPLRDATSGTQSYAAGRYLEPEAPTGPTLILDFNRATNPLCAYSEHYNCPMPPRFNVLPFAITAGAKAPH
jgi:uncharacterized protein (DUF1684 family)